MVCFIAHKRQCTIVGMIVLLMLLANLLPALNPALAQSCPTPTVTLSASSGGPGDDVIRIKGEGWVPDGSVGLTVPFNVDNVPVPDSSGTWEINGIVDFPAPPGT